MDLNLIYDEILSRSLSEIKENKLNLDPLIDNEDDNRRGLTLLIRPKPAITSAIAEMLEKFKLSEPAQYFYPISDIHITVMSIVSCYPGFDLKAVKRDDYIKTVAKSFNGVKKIKIKFKGLTMSKSGVLVKGFPDNVFLEKLRNNLRGDFAQSNLENSLDARYKIQTAHATVMRFKAPLRSVENFLQLFEDYKEFDFGTFEVDEYELVFNDWYQRQKNTVTFKTFK